MQTGVGCALVNFLLTLFPSEPWLAEALKVKGGEVGDTGASIQARLAVAQPNLAEVAGPLLALANASFALLPPWRQWQRAVPVDARLVGQADVDVAQAAAVAVVAVALEGGVGGAADVPHRPALGVPPAHEPR